MASYSVNPASVARAKQLIEPRAVVLEGESGRGRPPVTAERLPWRFASWLEYAHGIWADRGRLGRDQARYAFVYARFFRRFHGMGGTLASVYRASEWRHKAIELTARTGLLGCRSTPPQRPDPERALGRAAAAGGATAQDRCQLRVDERIRQYRAHIAGPAQAALGPSSPTSRPACWIAARARPIASGLRQASSGSSNSDGAGRPSAIR